MASGLNLTSFNPMLKEYYTQDEILNLVYKNNPFFAMVKKMEEFGGAAGSATAGGLPIPLIYGNPQGRSKTFSNALTRAQATSTQSVRYLLTRVRDHSIVTIDNETVLASQSSKGAFLSAMTVEVDGAINSLTRSIAIGMYGDDSAAIGQVSVEPTVSTTFVITLKSSGDITNYEVAQKIVIFAAKSGGSAKISETGTSDFTITGVDRGAGTITVAEEYDANGTIAADDFIFVEGDRGLGISGLEGWLPQTAPGATAFFGVDRSSDVTRLGGVRYDGSSDPIEEALIEGAARVGREGGKVDHCFISFAKWAQLEKALGSKVQYIEAKVGTIGFAGMRIMGPRGPINIIADQNCPDDKAYMLQLDTWKLYSLGNAVTVFDTDGLTLLRQSNDDGVEIRTHFYGNLGCSGPGYNCVVTLSS